MARTLALSQLTTDQFLRELHHFLWLDPVWNEGKLDQGWNSSDHAWVTALLAHALGHKPVLFRGRSFIIGGPTNVHNGFGVYLPQHAWVGIGDLGVIDLSIKTEVSVDNSQRKLPIRCVLGNSPLPRDRARLYVIDDPNEFGRAAQYLARQRKQISLLYLIENGEELNQSHVSGAADWIDSALTQKLESPHGKATDLYCALFLHLHGLLSGEADSLIAGDTADAWAQLTVMRDKALPQTLQLLNETSELPAAPAPQSPAGDSQSAGAGSQAAANDEVSAPSSPGV